MPADIAPAIAAARVTAGAGMFFIFTAATAIDILHVECTRLAPFSRQQIEAIPRVTLHGPAAALRGGL
jgi:hypothetical protein